MSDESSFNKLLRRTSDSDYLFNWNLVWKFYVCTFGVSLMFLTSVVSVLIGLKK